MSAHGPAEQLTLLKAPLQTLYYFSCSVASGLASAAHFVATHPFTLFLALPTLLTYLFCLITGSATEYTEAAEVRRVDESTQWSSQVWCVSASIQLFSCTQCQLHRSAYLLFYLSCTSDT
jgi:hypothetical protein